MQTVVRCIYGVIGVGGGRTGGVIAPPPNSGEKNIFRANIV